MEDQEFSLLNNSDGQSTVEYLLVLLVVVTLSYTVFQSQAFKDLFGQNSSLFAALQVRMEYSYRHALPGKSDEDNSNYNNSHDSYLNIDSAGKTRFFAPQGTYP